MTLELIALTPMKHASELPIVYYWWLKKYG